MNFNNKNEMKMIAAKGDSIGKWIGTSVFVCSVKDLAYRGSGAYYVLYDDENKIVGKQKSGWKLYGYLEGDGGIREVSPRTYTVVDRYVEAAKEEPAASDYTPGYDIEDRPTGDVRVEIDVEATLKKAREMTIDDLLEGFVCGL
jgi:hypothetical protein